MLKSVLFSPATLEIHLKLDMEVKEPDQVNFCTQFCGCSHNPVLPAHCVRITACYKKTGIPNTNALSAGFHFEHPSMFTANSRPPNIESPGTPLPTPKQTGGNMGALDPLLSYHHLPAAQTPAPVGAYVLAVMGTVAFLLIQSVCH
jgi:hypothetical protein